MTVFVLDLACGAAEIKQSKMSFSAESLWKLAEVNIYGNLLYKKKNLSLRFEFILLIQKSPKNQLGILFEERFNRKRIMFYGMECGRDLQHVVVDTPIRNDQVVRNLRESGQNANG